MFEFYSHTNPATGNTFVCSDLQSSGTQIESSGISIRSNHVWTPANVANTTWNPEPNPNPGSFSAQPCGSISCRTTATGWSMYRPDRGHGQTI